MKTLKITQDQICSVNWRSRGSWENHNLEDSTAMMAELSVVTGVKCLHQGRRIPNEKAAHGVKGGIITEEYQTVKLHLK